MKQVLLRAARHTKRRTAQECGMATGISEGRYFRIETGRTQPTAEEMGRLADFLGFSVATLFPDSTQRPEGRP